MTGGRVARWVIALVVVFAVGAATAWAVAVTVLRPSASGGSEKATTVKVTTQTIGRELSFAVTVRQPFVTVAYNARAGVVTAVHANGALAAGEVAYSVNADPVVAVVGTTPFYRDLTPGARGADVDQLTSFLQAGGFLSGARPASYTSAVGAAVRRWKVSLGEQNPSTTVTLGDVIAVPQLPSVVELGDAITLGKSVGGGEDAILARESDPTFSLVLNATQDATVPDAATAQVTVSGKTWSAKVASRSVDADGDHVIALTASDGGPVCGAECAALPAQAEVTGLANVEVAPKVTGASVPVGAVREGVSRVPYVQTPDGRHHRVTVTATADGIAVITGVAVGTRVVLFDAAKS